MIKKINSGLGYSIVLTEKIKKDNYFSDNLIIEIYYFILLKASIQTIFP